MRDRNGVHPWKGEWEGTRRKGRGGCNQDILYEEGEVIFLKGENLSKKL